MRKVFRILAEGRVLGYLRAMSGVVSITREFMLVQSLLNSEVERCAETKKPFSEQSLKGFQCVVPRRGLEPPRANAH